MRAHLVQLDIAWEDKPTNHRRIKDLLAPITVEAGDLIILPEMFDTGFSMNVETTHDADGRSLAFCQALAQSTGAFVHGSRTVLEVDGWARNRATIHDGHGDLAREYDKIHPFSFGRETERFRGGASVTTWQWAHGGESICVCPAVCYDLRFPELFRTGLTMGAEAYVIGANWPDARAEHWRALLIARAIENQAFVLGVNRAGRDPYLNYAGGSLVVDPLGRVVADAGEGERVVSARIDAEVCRQWRDRFPAWRDRRP